MYLQKKLMTTNCNSINYSTSPKTTLGLLIIDPESTKFAEGPQI
jgi:hypothetical protein